MVEVDRSDGTAIHQMAIHTAIPAIGVIVRFPGSRSNRRTIRTAKTGPAANWSCFTYWAPSLSSLSHELLRLVEQHILRFNSGRTQALDFRSQIRSNS